ncbi:MAG: hypothetical protein C0594_14090, partial [Marinilabiliales bacterium]
WKFNSYEVRTENDMSCLPAFEASEIEPFKDKSVLSDDAMRKQFIIARDLLQQYRSNSKPIDNIFQIDKLAQFYALNDLLKSYHCTTWHNHRYYYNPVLSRLEPIMYDCYPETGPADWAMKIRFLGYFMDESRKFQDWIVFKMFTHRNFERKYFDYLEAYTEKSFYQEVLDSLKSELERYEKMLKIEFPEYSYNYDFISNNVAKIKEKLPEFIEMNKTKTVQNVKLSQCFESIEDSILPDSFSKKLMKVYYSEPDSTCTLYNYFPKNLEILGFSDEKDTITFPLDGMCNAYSGFPAKAWMHKVSHDYKYLYFRVEGGKKRKKKISKYPLYSEYNPRIDLNTQMDKQNFSGFQFVDNQVVIPDGKWSISEPFIIFDHQNLLIEAGAEIDITGDGIILSYGSVQIMGTAEQPVFIYSSQGNANNSFNVLQADDQSVVSYCTFKGFNTLNYKGWQLTGAVNFYESDVDILHSSFDSNDCEDALNIIRSHFYVNDCAFKNIKSDAFDSDFCNGMIENSSFADIGNDAIDFSGSKVEIKNCEIDNAGDKGISGGEKSILTISGVKVRNSVTGITAKDLSRLDVSNSEISHCEYGLSAYVKKPEYGPAEITTQDVKLSEVKVQHLIEKKSLLNFNGKEIPGTEDKLADRLY